MRFLVSGINDGSVSRYADDKGEGITIISMIVAFAYYYFFYRYVIKNNKKDIGVDHIDILYWGLVYVFVSALTGLIPILYRFTAHFMVFFFYFISVLIKNMKRDRLMIIPMLFLFYYSPTARFLAVMENGLPYCSVFSLDKKYYKSIINETDAIDMYKTDD